MYSQSMSSWIGDPILVVVSVFQLNPLPPSSRWVKYTNGGSKLLWNVCSIGCQMAVFFTGLHQNSKACKTDGLCAWLLTGFSSHWNKLHSLITNQ